MNWNNLIRQTHRWLSIVFMVTVIITTIVLTTQDKPPIWVSFTPLPPLFLLMFTGLYLFVLPYVKRRSGRRPE